MKLKLLSGIILLVFLASLVIAVQGNGNQVQNQNKVVVNNEGVETELQIETGEQTRLRERDTEVETDLEIEQERNQTQNRTRLHVTLSNGRKAEIKIMPETASERARERLGELGFNITLKEVPIRNQSDLRLAYELEAQEEGKFLGLFKTKLKKQVQVDAETGQVIAVKKPWYSFLVA